MIKTRRKNRRTSKTHLKRLSKLVSHPFFWFLTLSGNAMIIGGAILIFYFESFGSLRPSFIDCVMWSTSIVTTIGFISWVPETAPGKVTTIIMMLLGTFFIWSYMAFLVSALITPALASIEKDVEDVEKELSELRQKETEHSPLAQKGNL